MLSSFLRMAVVPVFLAASGILAAGEQPPWIDSPNRPGYIGVVGYSAVDGMPLSLQRRVALTKARQELSRIVQTRIESEVSQQRSDGLPADESNNHHRSRLTSRTVLPMDKARQAEEWIDPVDRGLYLLLLLPESFLQR